MSRAGIGLLLTGLRRAVYALVAGPLALYCLGLLAAGRVDAAIAARFRSFRLARLPASAAPAPTAPAPTAPVPAAPSRGRLARHLLLSLPVDVLAFAVAGYVWLLLPMNLLYPVRLAIYDESAVGSWGGPTLAGAWALHAAGGLAAFLVVGLPIVAGLVQLQAWVAERTLGR